MDTRPVITENATWFKKFLSQQLIVKISSFSTIIMKSPQKCVFLFVLISMTM